MKYESTRNLCPGGGLPEMKETFEVPGDVNRVWESSRT